MSSSSAIRPTLPALSLSLDSIPNSTHDQGFQSDTSTASGHYDNIASSSSSIRSCSTASTSSNGRQSKPGKRVRFEESVSWTYFDENALYGQTYFRPQLEKKPSLWQRLRSRNSSADDVLNASAKPSIHDLKREDGSLDLLKKAAASRNSSCVLYSIQQPLRESAGRRYSRADTGPCFTSTPAAPKGDWNDLLGGRSSQQPQLVV